MSSMSPNRFKGVPWNMVSGVFLMGMVACSPLEPILDPEVSDLQLTVDTLRSSLRDAQRTIAELQIEIDQRRQLYADAQILRAQFEGSTREAERRLVEARHVIDLQREELAVARSERERMGRGEAALQGQLRQLRKQLSKIGKQAKGNASPVTSPAVLAERLDMTNMDVEQEALSDNAGQSVDDRSSAGVATLVTRPSMVTSHERVLIKPGDTLWRLARRYQTSVMYLMVINDLFDDRIHVGQTLSVPRLSDDAIEHGAM